MKTSQKLEIIQQALGVTQTTLATRLGVSFVTLNRWRQDKSVPHATHQTAIDALLAEVTGKQAIPTDELQAKKSVIKQQASGYQSIVKYIESHPDIRDQFILKLTYHSNSIEGSTLTEPDTAAILFDNVSLPHKSLTEQLEAKNHQTALQYLFQYVLDGGQMREEFVLKLHSILMNSLRPDAGTYRDHGVRIVGVHLPTANPLSVPRLVPEVVTRANERARDIVGLAAEVHSRFEQIHPFSDGNGRVGRLLMNAMFLRANIAPAIILQERKRAYYASLHTAQTTEDASRLEDFLCDAVLDGFKTLERKD